MTSDADSQNPRVPQTAPVLSLLRKERDRFFMALMFLTRLPVPPISAFYPELLSESIRYFPAVGALVGLIGGIAFWAFCQLWPPLVAACLAVILTTIATGAFHEDGLADAIDAFGGGFNAEKVLEIMKDSRIGTYGALALILSVFLRITIIASLPAHQALVMLVAAHMGSRTGPLLVMWWYEYARADASSKSKPVVQQVQGWNITFGLVSASLVIGWISPSLALRSAALVAVVALSTGNYYRKRLGGYTGDCLGMTQQIGELVILLSAY